MFLKHHRKSQLVWALQMGLGGEDLVSGSGFMVSVPEPQDSNANSQAGWLQGTVSLQ